ncbi:oligosaccharide flippase family protein [Balneolaceae bacterium ANBcel3]|nr:oligosaccharide flippase family protein [Balneolaceae bacterium ANBcel3]
MSMDRSKTMVVNTQWLYVSKIAAKFLGLISIVLVIRQLDVDVFGTYNLLLTSFVVFEILSLSAVNQVFQRFIPDFIANKEFKKFRKLVKKGILFSAGGFILILVSLYVLKDPFASFFNIETIDNYLYAFIIFCALFFFRNISSILLKSLLLHKYFSILDIVNNVVRLTLYIVFLNNLNVNILLYIESLLAIIVIIPTYIIYRKYASDLDYTAKPISETKVTGKRIIRYGLFSMGNVLGQGIVGRKSDYFIVAALSNPYQIGLYAFASRLYEMVYKVLPIKDFYSVLKPLFFHKYSSTYRLEDFHKMCAFMIKVLTPVYLFPTLYIIFFGRDIISIVFDERYLDAYWAVVILFLAKPFSPWFNTIGIITHLKERVDYEMYTKVIVVFSILAGIYGMKYFGIVGVATASSAGLVLQNLMLWFLMRKYPELKFGYRYYFKFIGMIVLLLPFAAVTQFSLNLYEFVVLSSFYLLSCIMITIYLHPFNEFDLAQLKKLSSKSALLSKSEIVIGQIYQVLPGRLK